MMQSGASAAEFLYVFHAVLRKVAARGPRGVKRSDMMRAPAGDGPNGATSGPSRFTGSNREAPAPPYLS